LVRHLRVARAVTANLTGSGPKVPRARHDWVHSGRVCVEQFGTLSACGPLATLFRMVL